MPHKRRDGNYSQRERGEKSLKEGAMGVGIPRFPDGDGGRRY